MPRKNAIVCRLKFWKTVCYFRLEATDNPQLFRCHAQADLDWWMKKCKEQAQQRPRDFSCSVCVGQTFYQNIALLWTCKRVKGFSLVDYAKTVVPSPIGSRKRSRRQLFKIWTLGHPQLIESCSWQLSFFTLEISSYALLLRIIIDF